MEEGRQPLRLLVRPQLRVEVEVEVDLEAEIGAGVEWEEQHQPEIMRGVSPSSLSLRLEEVRFLLIMYSYY